MNNQFYTQHQWELFGQDLARVFLDAGFEIIEEPYIDHGLCGFRATYLRRYLLHLPMSLNEGILTTVVHVVGLPFGQSGHKMVILTAPRDLYNEPVSDTLKLRVHFDEDGSPHIIFGEQDRRATKSTSCGGCASDDRHHITKDINHAVELEQIQRDIMLHQRFFGFGNRSQHPNEQLYRSLAKYVSHIIEAISPGLIQLPIEMKLEILKKLSIESIIKMSQVNNEFRYLIFKRGESLWRHLCYRDFKIAFINRMIHKSWMELYRDSYLNHQIEVCRKERALPALPELLALPPAPNREPIGWMPELLQLPFNPMHEEVLALPDNPMRLALEFPPLRRADSLNSLH